MLEGKEIIHIKKRAIPQWLTVYIVVMPLFLQALLQFFKIPGLIKYTIDIAWIVVLFSFFFRRRINLRRRLAPFAILITLFFCYCIVAYLFHFESPFYFLWGVRNNFRFYIAFFAIALLLDHDDIKTIFKLIDILFVVNLIVSVYQILVLGYIQDFCGGIFGSGTGSNASTLIFFSVVISKSMLLYMSGQEKAVSCWSKCSISLILAAFAELKFFFVIFVLILIMATLLTRFSWKKTVFVILATALVSISGSILTMIFESDISLQSIIHLMTTEHYSSSEDLGRFSAIPQLSKTILTEWPERLFGLGLGNCDTSSFSICNTPFYQAHQGLNYLWFSSACLFLELGLVGLIVYLMFFAMCFFKALRQIRNNIGELIYSQMAVIMAVLCVALTFYNSSLRTEIGYIAYFILALPFINTTENKSY